MNSNQKLYKKCRERLVVGFVSCSAVKSTARLSGLEVTQTSAVQPVALQPYYSSQRIKNVQRTMWAIIITVYSVIYCMNISLASKVITLTQMLFVM